MDEVNLQ